MSKFNKPGSRPSSESPVYAESTPSGRTALGAPGYARDAQSELFLLGVTNLVTEDAFHESAAQRDSRFAELVRIVAPVEPDWTRRFIRWLRHDVGMRSAPLVLANHAVNSALPEGLSGRHFVSAALDRAEEPGEALAYWQQAWGRKMAISWRRGVADAATRLYTQRSLLKWDSPDKPMRFGKVIELTHPTPRDAEQAALFRYAMDRRFKGNDADIPRELEIVHYHQKLMGWPVAKRRALFDKPGAADKLWRAGMTWEKVSGWLQGPLDATVWEALIPVMGYAALLRNLRNFDQAGVRDEVAELVQARLADPVEVLRARQFPMAYLSAYRATSDSLRWGHALEKALGLSLANIPELTGRTLILVDTSTSMRDGFSKDGTVKRWDAAVVFALALASRCAQADVVSFSSNARYMGDPPGANTKHFVSRPGESLLRGIERWDKGGYFLEGGTATGEAVRKHFHAEDHKRVVILTDGQYRGINPHEQLPRSTPLYTWNIAGYQYGHAPAGGHNRHELGGLTDRGFEMIPLLERGQDTDWPF
jgi:hypothetical protein